MPCVTCPGASKEKSTWYMYILCSVLRKVTHDPKRTKNSREIQKLTYSRGMEEFGLRYRKMIVMWELDGAASKNFGITLAQPDHGRTARRSHEKSGIRL
eukprot:scaffold798_cov162-Amphora_coffeaeformis.AAC.12